MIFLFPRWDMLVPWRVVLTCVEVLNSNLKRTKSNTHLAFKKDQNHFESALQPMDTSCQRISTERSLNSTFKFAGIFGLLFSSFGEVGFFTAREIQPTQWCSAHEFEEQDVVRLRIHSSPHLAWALRLYPETRLGTNHLQLCHWRKTPLRWENNKHAKSKSYVICLCDWDVNVYIYIYIYKSKQYESTIYCLYTYDKQKWHHQSSC